MELAKKQSERKRETGKKPERLRLYNPKITMKNSFNNSILIVGIKLTTLEIMRYKINLEISLAQEVIDGRKL